MAVKWVEDIDSGELLPVVDDECFDIPEHLKIADYNEVDYDKTIDFTVTQLQEQLLSAQNYIKEIQQDNTADVVPETPVPPAENVKKRFDIREIAKYSLYFFIPLAFILIASIIGLNYLSDNGFIELRANENLQSVSETNSKVSVSPVPVYGKIPAFSDGNGMYYYIDYGNSTDNEASTPDTDTSEDTENTSPLNNALKIFHQIFPIAFILLGLKFAISFMKHMVEGC